MGIPSYIVQVVSLWAFLPSSRLLASLSLVVSGLWFESHLSGGSVLVCPSRSCLWKEVPSIEPYPSPGPLADALSGWWKSNRCILSDVKEPEG